MSFPVLDLREPWIFPAAFAAAVAAVIAVVALLLPVLRRLNFGQRVRDDGPEAHRSKEGTPTMGGLAFLPALLIALLMVIPVTRELRLLLGVSLGASVLGAVDDLLKVALRRPLGLRARDKLAVQMILGALLGWGAITFAGRGTVVAVPWTALRYDLGLFYPVFTAFWLTGFSNAVNLTDGVDGLAAGGTAITALVFVLAALARRQLTVAIYGIALMGVCVGFLWHNFHPARVFMGDTGSLALGAALTGLAVVTGTELLLVVGGGLFVVETLSVIIQVTYFRLTGGHRLLRMSPLHHHFELGGHSEVTVVLSLWIFQVLCMVAAMTGLRGMGV
ncbi:MAG: phospho-N-acetylmuramoyl-pentapeptide-transferase [Bacillota bacterium]